MRREGIAAVVAYQGLGFMSVENPLPTALEKFLLVIEVRTNSVSSRCGKTSGDELTWSSMMKDLDKDDYFGEWN